MTQMTLNFQSTDSMPNSQFINLEVFQPCTVYDRVSSSEVAAYKYSLKFSNCPLTVDIFVVRNDTFVPKGSAYLDTISCADVLSDFDKDTSKNIVLNLLVYVNNSDQVKIKKIHPNLSTIINAYLIKDRTLRLIPQNDYLSMEWLRFDPSVNMYVINSSFIFVEETDYSNTPSCYYRTSPISTVLSNDYKYANRATLNICSNEIVEKDAAASGSVSRCPFDSNSHILSCPYYKEDKIKVSTVELLSKAKADMLKTQSYTSDLADKIIDAYIIRLIDNDSYSVVISEKDNHTGSETILKKFVYNSIIFNDDKSKNQVIEEVRNTVTAILSDYTFDYAHKVVYHINSMSELRKSAKITTKKSYLTSISQ